MGEKSFAVMGKLKIGIIMCSTRQERMCDRVAKFVQRAVETDHTTVLFDPLELDLPLTQPSMAWLLNPSAVSENVRQLSDQVAQCDGLVVVTAEYNLSVPPALANIVDSVLPTTCMWMPCAIVSYSINTIGGWRGAMQVRQLMGAVGCTVTQNQMGIPTVHTSLDPDGNPNDETLEQKLSTTLSQLYWLVGAINNHKAVEMAPPFSL